jgi:DNA polymerase-3 subunit epsilon
MISRRQFCKAVGASVVLASVKQSALAVPIQQPAVRRVAVMIESSGLSPDDGHRVIEVGAVELIGQSLTGRSFHVFLDPERDICPGAESVHGLSRDYLTGKPKFAEVAESLVAFVSNAEVLTHRAAFHIAFLDSEFGRIGMLPLSVTCTGITETLAMAKRRFTGRKNDLDSLCKRLKIERGLLCIPEQSALADATLVAHAFLSLSEMDRNRIPISSARAMKGSTEQ